MVDQPNLPDQLVTFYPEAMQFSSFQFLRNRARLCGEG